MLPSSRPHHLNIVNLYGKWFISFELTRCFDNIDLKQTFNDDIWFRTIKSAQLRIDLSRLKLMITFFWRIVILIRKKKSPHKTIFSLNLIERERERENGNIKLNIYIYRWDCARRAANRLQWKLKVKIIVCMWTSIFFKNPFITKC